MKTFVVISLLTLTSGVFAADLPIDVTPSESHSEETKAETIKTEQETRTPASTSQHANDYAVSGGR